MPVELYLAPAAAGKTEFALRLARQAAAGLAVEVRVVVASQLQRLSFSRRLAQAGGAIGVRVLSFDGLVAACLDAAGASYTEPGEAVQYRLLRHTLDRLPLDHYAPLRDKPGFVQVLQTLIRELKAAQIAPDAFAAAVVRLGNEPRLVELAAIYGGYQEQLAGQRWADLAGLHWLAVEGLAGDQPTAARDWPLLIVDGFDYLNPVQTALLAQLARRVGRLVVTLTEPAPGAGGSPALYPRFRRARRRLEEALGVAAEPLPPVWEGQGPATPPTRRYLIDNLFTFRPEPAAGLEGPPEVTLLEAPDQVSEAREALRWLKRQIVAQGASAADVALLARDVTPYRPFILETAQEFGLPLRLADGLPLAGNPAVAALLELLRQFLPSGDSYEPALPRRQLLEAWRSPYFEWPAAGVAIGPADADGLDAVARRGRVIGGLGQWRAAFHYVRRQTALTGDDEEGPGEAALPPLAALAGLEALFEQFCHLITPPAAARAMHDYAGWLEGLIGPDPEGPAGRPDDGPSLNLVAQARANEATADRDIAALQALKEVLRGLVWAEEAITPPGETAAGLDYSRFLNELSGALEAAHYQLPLDGSRPAILVANVVQARGLPLRAVAVVGLAEGLFPALLTEDPFLRDRERTRLREEFRLIVQDSTDSAEREFFYETVARPSQALLLTRPRLAGSGAEWVASPFWDEVSRLLAVTPITLHSQRHLSPADAASWPELLENAATAAPGAPVVHWLQQRQPSTWQALQAAAALFRLRQRPQNNVYHGYLGELAEEFGRRFGPDHVWSASRLERFRLCGYSFFAQHVLALQPRPIPEKGLSAMQLGAIYHRLFEALYQQPERPDGRDPVEALAFVARLATPILAAAPEELGFRETAWWAQTRQEIIRRAADSLVKLAELAEGYTPLQTEARFWEPQFLVIQDGPDTLRLHGLIDRVDRDGAGRIRVIDYKAGSPQGFTARDVLEGKRLQLALYALAAQEALGLGPIADGFYWHFLHGQPSQVTLSNIEGGIEAAVAAAVKFAWAAVHGVRAGEFMPQPPDEGCPSYCPAAAFCWHYQPRRGG